jgi:hypothetical protein
MPTIYQLPMQVPGMVGVFPNQKFALFGDNLATVTTAGYLNQVNLESNPVAPTDIIQALYSYNNVSHTGTYATFTVSISNSGVITLTEWSVPGAIITPTIANHIATYTNTSGTLSEDPATAISGGNIQAGLSGTAGFLASFPTTAATGSLRLVAASNAGNTVTQITNASFGQASVLTLPDPGGATANFVMASAALVSGNFVKASGTAGLVADGGAANHAGTTGTFAGGSTTNAFTATGMASTWIVTASNLTSTNSVSITKVVPSTNTLTITWSADPGAGTTVNWTALTAAI